MTDVDPRRAQYLLHLEGWRCQEGTVVGAEPVQRLAHGLAVADHVADVSGDAAPETGYQVLIDGQSAVVGGTSAVAPLWAALVALVNQRNGRNSGFLNPTLYTGGEANFYDITSGSNGTYKAAPGWDPCTGLGSPEGQKIATLIASSAPSV